MWILQRAPCLCDCVKHHSLGVSALQAACPAAQRFWDWGFLAATVLWVCGHLQAVFRGLTQANAEVVALRSTFSLFFLFASLLALQLDGCLHVTVTHRDRVIASIKVMISMGRQSGFELFVWNWNPHIAGEMYRCLCL